MKLLVCFALLGLFAHPIYAQTTLFQQNFDAGGPVSQYISSIPGADKFNGINGPSGAVSIVNGALQFDRLVDGTTGHFSHTTDFSPAPTSLYCQMDFEVVSATTTAGNSALLFYVGNAFSNGVGNPSNSEIYARFGINFTGNGYEFSVRSIPNGGGGSNSGVFTGRQTLTFVLNNTSYTVTYLQPGGGTKTLPNDTYDLWVGSSRVFTELPVLTPSQSMTDFKLRIDDDVYAAVFQFDNFLIRDINGALPLDLNRFAGSVNGPHIDLTWQTTGSLNAYQFAVERRTQTGEFTEVGQSMPVTMMANGQRFYTLTDEQPTPGLNYYRLRQTDQNGVTAWSKLIQVRYDPDQPALILFENPVSPNRITLRTHALEAPTYLLTTLAGQLIPFQTSETPDGQVTLLPQHPLSSGVYLLTATAGSIRLTRRVLVH